MIHTPLDEGWIDMSDCLIVKKHNRKTKQTIRQRKRLPDSTSNEVRQVQRLHFEEGPLAAVRFLVKSRRCSYKVAYTAFNKMRWGTR